MRTKGFQINQLNYQHVRFTAIFSLAVILLSAVYFFQPFTSETSYADTDSASGTYNGTTYSLTTAVSDLNLELTALPSGSATYGKQTVNVTTNAPGGYQLYMQTTGDLAGTLNGAATSDSIAALPANNSALDMNSWGYVTAASLTAASTTLNDDADTAATQAVWSTPPSTLTQVDSTSSAATSGRDTDIYYGIKADNSLNGDNYSGTITYTAVGTADVSGSLTISPISGAAGSSVTITTPLLTASTISTSEVTATIGGSACTVTNTGTSTGVLVVTCTTSGSLSTGIKDVTVSVPKYGRTYSLTNGYTVETGLEITDVTRSGDGYAGENNNTLTITTSTTDNVSTSNISVTLTDSSGNNYTCSVTGATNSSGYLVVTCSVPTSAIASTYKVAVTISGYGTATKSSAFTLSNFTLRVDNVAIATPNTSTTVQYFVNRYIPTSATAKLGGSSLSTSISDKQIVNTSVSKSAGTYDLSVTATWNGKTYSATKSSALVVKDSTVTTGLNETTYMSSMTASNCAAATEFNVGTNFQTYQVTDRRNDEKYYVRKFGNYCIMVENLHLEGGTKLTSTYSNVSSSYTLPASTTSGYYTSNTTAQMYIGRRYRRTNNSGYDGSYYSWCAATAGTGGCYGTNQAAGTYDICPKNWHLPTKSELSTIRTYVTSTGGINSFFTNPSGAPVAPIYSGYYGNSSLHEGGRLAYWWSSAQYGSNGAFYLYAYSGSLSGANYDKYRGLSVRCLLPAS